MDFSNMDSVILDSLPFGVYCVDKNNMIIRWTPRAEELTGYSTDEKLVKSCDQSLLCSMESNSEYLCGEKCPLKATIAENLSLEADVFIRTKEGARIPIHVRTIPLQDNSQTIGAVAILEPILLEEKETNSPALASIAMTDALTGLYNRRYGEAEISLCLNKVRNGHGKFAVLFFDLDDFHDLNNTYGHAAGDAALVSVSQTITENPRELDFYFRYGGEEFVGLHHIQAESDLAQLGERLRRQIEQITIHYNEHQLKVTVSVGVTLLRHEDTLESVISRADTLMYQSKIRGKNCVTCDC